MGYRLDRTLIDNDDIPTSDELRQYFLKNDYTFSSGPFDPQRGTNAQNGLYNKARSFFFDGWCKILKKFECKSKLWLCDGDCAMCEYHAAGNTTSLDAPLENGNGDEFSLVDTLEDPNAAFADVIVDRLLLEKLLDELAEQDPEGKRICELIMEGSSKTEIADTLQREFGGNWYKSKAAYREKQVLDQLHKRILDFM